MRRAAEVYSSRERTSGYIKIHEGIFLPAVWITSRLACEAGNLQDKVSLNGRVPQEQGRR